MLVMFDHCIHNDRFIIGIDYQAAGEEIPDASQYKNTLLPYILRRLVCIALQTLELEKVINLSSLLNSNSF